MIIRNIWSSLRHPQILAISNRKNIHTQTPKKNLHKDKHLYFYDFYKNKN